MTSMPLWSMKQASSLPSYNFLFLGRSRGIWRRTAPGDKHQPSIEHLHEDPSTHSCMRADINKHSCTPSGKREKKATPLQKSALLTVSVLFGAEAGAPEAGLRRDGSARTVNKDSCSCILNAAVCSPCFLKILVMVSYTCCCNLAVLTLKLP